MVFRANGRLCSGPVELNAETREVTNEGVPVGLSGLPFRILEQLMLAEGRVVTRIELKRILWPYAERIDTERRLNTAIRGLREALGDEGSKPRLIQTVRGHGYRWIAQEETRPPRVRLHAIAASLALLALTGSSWRAWQPSVSFDVSSNPASGDQDLRAHRSLAWRYVNQGQDGAALPHLASLLQAPSQSPTEAAEMGWLLLRAGMPTAALAACSRAVAPTLNLLSCRQTALGRLGLVSDARTAGVEVMRAAQADEKVIQTVAQPDAKTGYQRFLQWRIGAFVRPNRDWFQRAQLQADAGLYGAALASLRRAAQVHDPLLVKIASSSEFTPLRRSPDFQRIAAKALTDAQLS